MKVLKIVFSIVIFFFTLSVGAQKIKIKKGNVTIDDTLVFKTDKGFFTGVKSVYDLKDNELIFIQWDSFINKTTGEEVKYCSITFPNLDLKTEVRIRTFKGLLKLFIKNKLFKGDTLIEEKVQLFVKKYGLEFSKIRKEQNQEKVIIINNEPSKQKKSIRYY